MNLNYHQKLLQVFTNIEWYWWTVVIRKLSKTIQQSSTTPVLFQDHGITAVDREK